MPEMRNQHNIQIPNVFAQQELDPTLVASISNSIIGQTQTETAERERQLEESNNMYHMQRLAEQAAGMTREEALVMCKNFGEDVLIEALQWYANINIRFKQQVIAASEEALAELGGR